MHATITLLLAYIVDRIVGDPRFLTHPVVIMGRVISWLEKQIRRGCRSDRSLKWAGLLFPLVLVGGSYMAIWVLIYALSRLSPWLAWAAEIWLISTTIASKGLADAGMDIFHHLKKSDLSSARTALSMVVGRDTDKLDEPQIVRGAVETVAENMVDAIISPLFFAAIGGAPLAMAYRAANTLDSMVGYKDERYLNLGWASARFDDLTNYIPARLCALFIVVAAWLHGQSATGAWRMMRRDARKHPSPNSGFAEAGVAGALGIQLGGLNTYRGVASHRALLGEPTRPLEAEDIPRTVAIMHTGALIGVGLFVAVLLLISYR
ncbi:cobalamin biosynthesis protein CobD [Brevibacillus fluminis]|uniref:Cobalamin biosynthesis protein CobD n=1 Tax=Brevibacillus fluminis TaxID=511487 RepID=A0A3M8CWY4_9BACL|nr:adenosylcobinamide-phosphate synthase CbiB [Brevibacillus fluminis]RNB80138.1 cobalamin biosynthesis protein CobD [Brevibacillus fluminis]